VLVCETPSRHGDTKCKKWITNEHVDANAQQAIRSGVIDTGLELARTYGG
jgi:hypothetical protein